MAAARMAHVLLRIAHRIVRRDHPLGGTLLPPVDLLVGTRGMNFLSGFSMASPPTALHRVRVLVANEAFDDGVPPLAGPMGVVASRSDCRRADPLLCADAPPDDPPAGRRLSHRSSGGHWSSLQGGFGLSIYAYWRVTQRAMRRAQAGETERAYSEQRVQTARLLALQSRVEPQLLFDTLGRVGRCMPRPGGGGCAAGRPDRAAARDAARRDRADNSTVEREFAARRSLAAGHCAAPVAKVRTSGCRCRPEAHESASRRCW